MEFIKLSIKLLVSIFIKMLLIPIKILRFTINVLESILRIFKNTLTYLIAQIEYEGIKK